MSKSFDREKHPITEKKIILPLPKPQDLQIFYPEIHDVLKLTVWMMPFLETLYNDRLEVYNHSIRLARSLDQFAKSEHLPFSMRSLLVATALIHDIGKLNVPQEILDKPNILEDHERYWMESHVKKGVFFIEEHVLNDEFGQRIIAVMKGHHGHDQTGLRAYPEEEYWRSSDERITVAQIYLGIFDVTEALLSTERQYKTSSSPEKTKEILMQQFGQLLDPQTLNKVIAIRLNLKDYPNQGLP